MSIEKKDPKEFWNLIKKMRNWDKNQSPTADSIDPSEWLKHFTELFQEPAKSSEISLSKNEPSFSELDFLITNSEVASAFKKLKEKSADGPDKILSKLIIIARSHLIESMTIIFNKIFQSTSYPSSWTYRYLITIFKGDVNWDPNNYRGIAIGSCLAKLYSIVLLNRLENRLKTGIKNISANQIGFRKNYRTSDHIFVLSTMVTKIVKLNKKRLYVAFIDFQKAYDSINRSLLFRKLQEWQIGGLFYENIKAMYLSVNYLVKVKGGVLDPLSSQRGLIQGGILSPCLFNIYIDDIKDIFDDSCDPVNILGPKISHLLYADDLLLISKTEAGLNKCLNNLFQFCKKWEINLNIKKTKIIVFNEGGKIIRGEYRFGTQLLEITNQYCYLGIEIKASGSFAAAKEALTEKSRKAMMPLISTMFQFKTLVPDSISLFNSFIQPIALYNAEIWCQLSTTQLKALHENKTDLLKLMLDDKCTKNHLRFLKIILGVNRSCSNLAVMGETGQIPLIAHGYLAALKYWHRMEFMTEDTLAKYAYNIVKTEKLPWYQSVEIIMQHIGLGEYFLNPNSEKNFKLASKKCMFEHIQYLWYRSLKSNKRLKFYNSLKKIFVFETYLDNLPDYRDRKLVTKLRCSNHNLQVEKGRHSNIPNKERICKLCNKQVETEKHYLTYCPKFNTFRQRGFTDTWYEDIKCKNKDRVYPLVKFLRKAEKIRKQSLPRSHQN